MLAGFHPDGSTPATERPQISVRDGKLYLSCATQGASMGYHITDDRWQLYHGPVDVDPGQKVVAKAVRYGWEESESVSLLIP